MPHVSASVWKHPHEASRAFHKALSATQPGISTLQLHCTPPTFGRSRRHLLMAAGADLGCGRLYDGTARTDATECPLFDVPTHVVHRMHICDQMLQGSTKKKPAVPIVHVHRLLDVNPRAEWFDDVDASRVGTRADFGEITTGLNIMPARAVNFRPEDRWDVAGTPVLGPTDSSKQNHQMNVRLRHGAEVLTECEERDQSS